MSTDTDGVESLSVACSPLISIKFLLLSVLFVVVILLLAVVCLSGLLFIVLVALVKVGAVSLVLASSAALETFLLAFALAVPPEVISFFTVLATGYPAREEEGRLVAADLEEGRQSSLSRLKNYPLFPVLNLWEVSYT